MPQYAQAGNNNDIVNGLAMALSRREEAPDALSYPLLNQLLGMLDRKLEDCVEKNNLKVAFRNTLSAIAGLFRWRKREPRAFLAASDPVAAALRQTVVAAQEGLQQQLRRTRQANPPALRAIQLMKMIVEYLDGAGDPDILRQIEADD